MGKYFVTFNIPAASIDQWISTVSEADRKEMTEKMMSEWEEWMTAHEAQVVDKGNPLGKTKRVDANGVSDTRNDMNYYIIIEAESHEGAANMLVGHPHLVQIPSAYAEVVDMTRPGM